MPQDAASLTDLAAAADVTPRTVRYYISQGLLPGPIGQGSAARYTPEHLTRLRAVRRLSDEGLSLARIRDHLSRMPEEAIERLAGGPDTPADQPPAGANALAYIRGVLSGPPPAATDAPPSLHARAVHEPPHGRYEPSFPDAFPSPGERPKPGIAPVPSPAQLPPASMPRSEPGADRSTWERISLTPDIELHVRRPLDRGSHRRLEQLLELARQLFGGR